MFNSNTQWASRTPEEHVWLISLGILVVKNTLDFTVNLCRAARRKGGEHGRCIARSDVLNKA